MRKPQAFGLIYTGADVEKDIPRDANGHAYCETYRDDTRGPGAIVCYDWHDTPEAAQASIDAMPAEWREGYQVAPLPAHFINGNLETPPAPGSAAWCEVQGDNF